MVLGTGGAGYIGGVTIELLRERGWERLFGAGSDRDGAPGERKGDSSPNASAATWRPLASGGECGKGGPAAWLAALLS